jgi:threonyl-tRNA synthetase
MTMPDMHVFCKDVESSKDICLKLHRKVYEEFGKLDHDLVCLYNLTKSFFDKNKEFFKELESIEKKPLLLRFVPENKYYWVVNVEHHIVDKMKRPREIATWQIDVGNAERFDIKFTDKDNKQKRPVIIHTAILGTIERYIYSAFDYAIRQKNPLLPLWLTPVQVRLCSINDSFNSYCEKVAEELERHNIRSDIDDRVESIDKKIRDSETDWIPYIIVIGEREKESGKLAVRSRETGKVKNISSEELTKEIKEKLKGYPYNPLPLPRNLTKRPSFI